MATPPQPPLYPARCYHQVNLVAAYMIIVPRRHLAWHPRPHPHSHPSRAFNVASRRIASRLPWVQLIFLLCFPFMLCFCYLQRFFFCCFLFYIFLFLFLLAILAKFERSAATAAALCISFFLRLATFTLHATCPRCPHTPLLSFPTLSPLNGAAHFATLMPIWCTSLSLCHAATAATLPLAVVIPKSARRRWLPWFATALPLPLSPSLPFPSLLLPHLSRVE